MRLDQGHLRIPVPEKGSQAAVEIWDSKGRQFHQVKLKSESSFETVIEDGRIKVYGQIPKSGVILKDISNPKRHKALGPVKYSESTAITWPLPQDESVRAIQVFGINEMAQQVHDISSSNKGHRFQTPPTLRLQEDAFAELILTNPLDTPQRFDFRLEPTEAFEANDSHSGSIVAPGSSTTITKIRIKPQMYGTHGMTLQVQGETKTQLLRSQITVLQSGDDQTTEVEYHLDVFKQGRVTQHELDANQISYFMSDVKPSLSLMRAIDHLFRTTKRPCSNTACLGWQCTVGLTRTRWESRSNPNPRSSVKDSAATERPKQCRRFTPVGSRTASKHPQWSHSTHDRGHDSTSNASLLI